MSIPLPRLSPVLLLALLSGPVVLPVLSTPAFAQAGAPLFQGIGLIELLPVGVAVGDGSTPLSLHVLMLNPDGTPMIGMKPKVEASTGKVGDWTELGNGLYTVLYTPPKLTEASTATLTLKGKTASKGVLDKAFQIALQPALPTNITITANPAEVVLGQDKSISLNISLNATPGQPTDTAKLKVISSSGTVEALTHLGGGAFTARYTPPAVNYPHLAIVTVVDERSPSTVYGSAAIKLVGKTDFPVSAAPGATVIVRVGDRDYGPYTADGAGSARVPLMVPPGISQATLISVVNGVKGEQPLDLKLPATRRLGFFPTQTMVPADPQGAIPVRVAVATPLGAPDTSARVILTASAGTLSAVSSLGNGVYQAMFTPPALPTGGKATITASLDGEPSVQSSSLEIALAPQRATGLTQTIDPATLPPGATGFKVFNHVTAADGSGLTGREMLFSATGARPQGASRDLRGGDYETTFATNNTEEGVRITTTVLGPASGNPLRHVVLVPSTERVVNNGRETVLITVVTADEFGYPVPNQIVNLKVAAGDGQIGKQVTTDARGIAYAYYTSGTQAGVAQIRANVGDATAAIGMLQLPVGVIPAMDLPTSGAQSTVATLEQWNRMVPTTVINRQGATAAANVGTADPSGRVGAITTFSVSAQPGQVAPGGSVTVTIQASDASGRGVGGQSLKVLATGGSATGVSDVGGGAYTTTLTVPAGSAGEAMVVVTTADGSVTKALSVPINAPAWGDTGAAATTTTPTTTWGSTEPTPTTPTPTTNIAPTTPTTTTEIKPPKEPRQKPEPGDYPWLRVRGGFLIGSYTYTQDRTASDSPLWEDDVNVEGALPVGFDLEAGAWLPMLPILGAEVSVRSGFYSVTWPGTESQIPDVVPTISGMARVGYPIDLGSSQLRVGAKVGGLYGDFITYTGSGGSVSWGALPVAGFGVGAELGFAMGERLHANLDYVQGLRPGPFSYNAGLDLGVQVAGPLYLGGAVNWTRRSTQVVSGSSGAEVGVLSDNQIYGVVGPGLQF